jgi:predicted dehydrogenase
MKLPIRFAVVGAGRSGAGGSGRGKTFVRSAAAMRGQVELVAICDTDPVALEEWRAQGDVRCYADYQQVLEDPEIDAVCIATPLKLHAQQSIQALQAGKHVLCEVTAAWTLDECWELIAAVERSGLTYMMAENYCFARDVLMVQNMVEQGVFGDIITAEGAYIHAVPSLLWDDNGELTWRGVLRRDEYSNIYPTHSLGPVCRWLGVNRSDRLKSTATWQSRSLMVPHYARRRFGDATPWAAQEWKLPDAVNTLIRTEKGVLIDHYFDAASPRPHHMNRYALQGTHASFTSPIDARAGEPLVWIEGRSPVNQKGDPESWEPLYKYAEEFEHPLWKQAAQEAARAGHGGGDYFVLREFAAAVVEGRPPLIDVYDAVTWSSLTPLSAQSLASDNAAVEVPDFKRGASA